MSIAFVLLEVLQRSRLLICHGLTSYVSTDGCSYVCHQNIRMKILVVFITGLSYTMLEHAFLPCDCYLLK